MCIEGIKRGFTLAEVLITLGIIGVVAAMTLPTLLQGYQKSVALNKLKQVYAQVQTAVDTAATLEFDGTPINQWSCPGTDPDTGITYDGIPTTYSYRCFYIAMKKIAVKMYPSPDDVSHAFCYEGKEYRPYTAINGNVGRWNTNGQILHTGGVSAKLPNGACVVWHPGFGSHDASGTIVMDIDGPYAGYNQAGKDVFVFSYLINGNPIGTNGRSILPDRLINENPQTRAQLLSKCSKNISGANGISCAALIINDGWQMKSDYPW